jgi:RNA polymerase sigma factor (sigma-70 family)
MAQMKRILDQIRRLTLRDRESGDAELLGRFRHDQDEAAFEELLRRHGPMILGVCRRVLRNDHDIEDAFQATILVFVRKIGSINSGKSLANWLYGVAYRTALHARSRSIKDRMRDRRVAIEVAGQAQSSNEMDSAIDEELNRLPERYRLPILLCELQGKTHKDAASTLGWPEGTLSVRLMRGKQMLSKRLTRRGLAPAALLALASTEATAGVSRTRLHSAFDAAKNGFASPNGPINELADGVLRMISLNKLKTIGVSVVAIVVTISAMTVLQRTISSAASLEAGALVQEGDDEIKKRPNEQPQKVDSKEVILSLKKERIDALRKLRDWRQKNYSEGRENVSDYLIEAERLLLAAELDISKNSRERLNCYEHALKRVNPVATVDDAKFKAGKIAPSNYYLMAAFRLELQILREEAKAQVEAAK